MGAHSLKLCAIMAIIYNIHIKGCLLTLICIDISNCTSLKLGSVLHISLDNDAIQLCITGKADMNS